MMASVYTIYWDKFDEYTAGLKPLDGNFRQVFPTGYEFDPNSNDPAAAGNMILLPDRTYVKKTLAYQGLPVDLTHVPTRVEYTGRAEEMVDLMQTASWFIMSGRMKDVIEGLEPGRHQFKPVELVGKDGRHLADHFWFSPCNRIDSMDREHTTHEFYRERKWKFVSGGKYVASLERINGHHIWIDPRVPGVGDYLDVSEDMRSALLEAGLTGLGFHATEAV